MNFDNENTIREEGSTALRSAWEENCQVYLKSVSDLKFRKNMCLGRKLQEEFIFFYQKEVFWLQTNWQNAVYRHFSDGERYQGDDSTGLRRMHTASQTGISICKMSFENFVARKIDWAKN